TTSVIAVSGAGTSLTSITVRIPNISHTWYDDLDIMLISPTGQRIILMSDCGGNNSGTGNRDYTFIQGGTALSDGAAPTASGNVSPTNFGAETWPDGAPTITAMNQFTGNPNGNWTLRVLDDGSGDTGCLTGGWSITIVATTPSTPPLCAATPTAPTNGATNVALAPTLSWAAVANATGYDVYFGTANPATTLVSTNQAGLTYAPTGLLGNTTNYWRVVPRNSAGSASGCSTWSFTTGLAGCLNVPNGLWPGATYTPICNGSPESIVTDGWTGEYSNVNLTSGVQYIFSSSVATDYITISNATGTTILASGTSPLNWTSNVTGTVRFNLHNNVSCGTEQINRTRFIQCGTPPSCAGTLVTLNMTDSWGDGWEGAEMRLISSAGTVFGPYTLLTGTTGSTQICLPNDCYRIVLSAGVTPTEIGWSLTNGATTYASAASPNAAAFNTFFTIGGVSCTAAPSNDLCANAPIIDLGANANQTHTGTGIGSTNTLGLTQHSQTWVRIVVPCGGMNVSMNFCGSTPVRNNAYINLFSDCGAAPVLTTATNWNFTSCANGSITLNWNNVPAGTYYYPILIDNIAWPGAYSLNISGTTLYTPAVAPASISGTTTVCSGQSTTLTLQGGSAGTNGVAEWFAGSCGSAVIGTGNSIPVSPTVNTTYFVRYAGSCNTTACVSVPVTINTASTAPLLSGPSSTICPNSTVTLNASGGTAGTGSQIEWWTGPNGTGTNLGTGASASVTPSASTTYYVRRSGTCNTTTDATVTVNVKSFIYAANNTSSTGYCTDDSGWNHFFNGDNIIFSVQGNLSGAPVGFPVASIFDNGAFYSQTENPSANCGSNQNPGEQRFEMERGWDLNFGGGTPTGTYNVRFYYQLSERQAVETAAANWITANPACGYSYKYTSLQQAINGFYWFKNSGSAYSAPDYDGIHLQQGGNGTTPNGINYSLLAGITSFSGGSGAIILSPISALPVELISFTANCNETGDKVNVNWTTASEHNSMLFAVEHSENGTNWDEIGVLDAAGNSVELIDYVFVHESANRATNYYRIVQVDQDGVSKIYGPVSANCFGEASAVTSYPNPSTNDFTVAFNGNEFEGETVISMIDQSGRTVFQKVFNFEKEMSSVYLHDVNLAPGVYQVVLVDQNSKSASFKQSIR
ncbi:MAG: proprotein convertase P-domain-containing protein, partial [Flavobacteriales bacterium]